MNTNTSSKRQKGSLSAFLGWLLFGLPFRWVFGLPLVGRRLTDATFTHDGKGWLSEADRRSMAAFFTGGEPTRWDLMAGYKRAAWRVFGPAAVLGVAWCWINYETPTAIAATLTAGVAVGALVASWVVRWQRREHMARYVRPLAVALAPALGWSTEKLSWLSVPRNFKSEGAVIRVDLPADFVDGDDQEEGGRGSSSRSLIDKAVYKKLGLPAGEMTSRYELVGAFPQVEYRWRPQVPASVDLEDVREAIESATGAKFVLGLGRGRKAVVVDIDDDSPHIAQSVGSGGGKSVQIGLIAAQLLARGGRVVILDPKRGSHRWAIGHPNVSYCRSLEEMHDALMLVGREMDRRQRATDEDEHAIDDAPRVLVIVEERNTLMERIPDWWAEHREIVKAETGMDAPKTCPSLRVLREIAFMGREPRLHLLSAAQQATAQTMGGGAARENYVARIMGRGTTPQTWAFLAPGRDPHLTERKGRFFLAMGSSVQEFQGANLSRRELHALAWSCFADKAAELEAKERPAALFFREPDAVAAEVVEAVTSPSAGLSSPVPDTSIMPSDLGQHPGTVPAASPAEFAVSTVQQEAISPVKHQNAEAVSGSGLTLIESPVTLREAVARHIVTVSPDPDKALEILKSARKREEKFPASVGQRSGAHVFDPAELRRWERNRASKSKVETA